MGSLHRGFYLVSLGVWGFLALFLLSLPVMAAPVEYEAVRVGNGQYTTSGVGKPITVKVKANGVPKHQQIVPVVPKSTLRKFAQRAVKGGFASLAIGGVIDGLGFFIDQLSRDIKKKEKYMTEGNLYRRDDNAAPWNEWDNSHKWLPECESVHGVGSCTYNIVGGPGSPYYNIVEIRYGGEEKERVVDLSPADITRLENALSSNLSLPDKNALINKILSQTPISGLLSTDDYPLVLDSPNNNLQQLFDDWPNIQQLLQSMLNAHMSNLLAELNPEHQLTPEEQSILDQSSIAPPPEIPPELTLDFELPAFCEWASFICQPFVGEAHPDVPVLDLEVQDYESGLPSSASCPAPVSVELSIFGTHELSYQPICDFAGMIRIPVIAISYLIAGFIVVGVRR